MTDRRTVDLSTFFDSTAKLAALPEYVTRAKALAGEGQDVILTGQAPVWLYLVVAHALHAVARRLIYTSPNSGDVVVFDHDPF